MSRSAIVGLAFEAGAGRRLSFMIRDQKLRPLLRYVAIVVRVVSCYTFREVQPIRWAGPLQLQRALLQSAVLVAANGYMAQQEKKK